NQFRNVPFLTKLEMSPFSRSVCFSFFSQFSSNNFALAGARNDESHLAGSAASPAFGFARSEVLRSPEGEAVRAERRAKPRTLASPIPAMLFAGLPAVPPRATDDPPEAPICVAPPQADYAGPRFPPHSVVCEEPGFPPSAAPARDTRWPRSPAALHRPAPC